MKGLNERMGWRTRLGWGRRKFVRGKGGEDVRFEGEERELVRDVPLPKHHLINLDCQLHPTREN